MKRLSGILALASLCFVTAGSAEAQTRLERTFENWRVICVEGSDNKNCRIVQAFTSRQARGPVFSWTVVREGEGEKAIIRTPTNVLLQEGVRIRFGDGEPLVAQFRLCGPRFCLAEVPFTAAWAEAFGAGQAVPVSFTAANGRAVDINLDLKGFSQALQFFNEQLSS